MKKPKINITRKILSLFIILFAIFYHITNKKSTIALLSILLILFLFFDILYKATKGKNKTVKAFYRLYPKKEKEYGAILSDATIALISMLIITFTFTKEITIYSLIIWTVIDTCEQIFGILYFRGKLPWNKDKAISGTHIGAISGIVFGQLTSYCLQLQISMTSIIIIGIIAALAGTAKKYDNISIPWTISIILYLLY